MTKCQGFQSRLGKIYVMKLSSFTYFSSVTHDPSPYSGLSHFLIINCPHCRGRDSIFPIEAAHFCLYVFVHDDLVGKDDGDVLRPLFTVVDCLHVNHEEAGKFVEEHISACPTEYPRRLTCRIVDILQRGHVTWNEDRIYVMTSICAALVQGAALIFEPPTMPQAQKIIPNLVITCRRELCNPTSTTARAFIVAMSVIKMLGCATSNFYV